MRWEEGNVIHLDVRPILEAGDEPYSVIMKELSIIDSNHELVIHVLFDPVPLRTQIKNRGFVEECTKVDVDHWLLKVKRFQPLEI
jgi:hypothetical protein